MESTTTQTPNIPRPFDLVNEEDAQELKNWCRVHWQYTLTKGIQNSNTPFYHDCCVSFSRRGCVKRLSHPPLQSASVLKIPSLRNVESPEALYEWLRERLIMHYSLGKKVFFPSINIAHFDSEENKTDEDQKELLCKRVEQLSEEKLKTEQEVRQLREDNNKLLHSSKSWYTKYQELIFRIEGDTPSYTEITPKKTFSNREAQNDDDYVVNL